MLTALTAAYGLANVLVFYTTGSFGPLWFAASVLVYGLLLASAIALSFLDTGRPASEAVRQAPEAEAVGETGAARGDEAEAPARSSTELRSHETVYETRTGRLVRARFGLNGEQTRLLFAISGDEVLPVDAIETRLDDVQPQASGQGSIEDARDAVNVVDVEEALGRRSRPNDPVLPEASDVDVRLLDHEVLHRSEGGRILRARYDAEGEEHVRLFVVTDEAVVPVDEIEGSLDTLQVDELPLAVEEIFEETIARSASTASTASEPQAADGTQTTDAGSGGPDGDPGESGAEGGEPGAEGAGTEDGQAPSEDEVIAR